MVKKYSPAELWDLVPDEDKDNVAFQRKYVDKAELVKKLSHIDRVARIDQDIDSVSELVHILIADLME